MHLSSRPGLPVTSSLTCLVGIPNSVTSACCHSPEENRTEEWGKNWQGEVGRRGDGGLGSGWNVK